MPSLKENIESVLQEEVISSLHSGTVLIETVTGKQYFLKSGKASRMYSCEANGLLEIEKAQAIRVSKVISVNDNYIITEYIQSGVPSALFFKELGRQLARMHRYESASFGFYEDNFIGNNPQLNIAYRQEKTNWIAFYFNKRLLFQYQLAEQNGHITSDLKSYFLKLEKRIDTILDGVENKPCLLHGDLWNGNYLVNKNAEAVLIDPAVYYGDREADLAMTKLFGGFSGEFYTAYMEEYPLTEGWEYRENIYMLYHLLNHLNIFGKSYLAEVERILYCYVNKF